MRRLNVSWCLVLGALSCAARPPAGPTAAASRSAGESSSAALPGYAAEVPSALLPRAEPLAMRDAERIPVGPCWRGRADALVTVVVFSDFQCPFCARVVPTLAALSALRRRHPLVWEEQPAPLPRPRPPGRGGRDGGLRQGRRGGLLALPRRPLRGPRPPQRRGPRGRRRRAGRRDHERCRATSSRRASTAPRVEADMALAQRFAAPRARPASSSTARSSSARSPSSASSP
nr:thioredoxin domain-containing protein [Deltaproteobacteria bacterium]